MRLSFEAVHNRTLDLSKGAKVDRLALCFDDAAHKRYELMNQVIKLAVKPRALNMKTYWLNIRLLLVFCEYAEQ